MTALLLALALSSADDFPRSLEGVERFGCKAEYVGGEHIHPGWHVRPWVERSSGQESILYSVRDDVDRALDDCKAWIKRIRKRLQDKQR